MLFSWQVLFALWKTENVEQSIVQNVTASNFSSLLTLAQTWHARTVFNSSRLALLEQH